MKREPRGWIRRQILMDRNWTEIYLTICSVDKMFRNVIWHVKDTSLEVGLKINREKTKIINYLSL